MSLARIVVLEGPDGAGKTTLANWLRDKHGYQIVKTGATKPGENVFVNYTNTLLAAIAHPGCTVLDRFHIGEAVYGPLLRGEDRLGDQGRALIERIVAARGVALVICSPPWPTLLKGWRSKDDLLKRVDQLRAVRCGFLSEAKRLELSTYDWTRGKELTTNPAPPLPAVMTGYHQADTLWVGERPGKARVEWDLPFHSVTGSARYLWESLPPGEERRWAWVNAFNAADEPSDLTDCVNSLPRLKQVVALGKVAARECTRQGVAYAILVPHPQYWRRFHHHEQAAYAELLKEATR